MSFESLLTHTMTVERKTDAQDEIGAPEPSWSDELTEEPCRLEPLSATERDVFGRRGVVVSHRCFVKPNKGITEADRIEIGGTTYNVVSAPGDLYDSTEAHHSELLLLEFR